MITILVLAAVVVGMIAFAPRVRQVNDPSETSWIDGGLKAAVIFIGVVVLTVFLPSYVLKLEQVAELDRGARDAIGTVVWGMAFVGSLWLLWYAQRHDRV